MQVACSLQRSSKWVCPRQYFRLVGGGGGGGVLPKNFSPLPLMCWIQDEDGASGLGLCSPHFVPTEHTLVYIVPWKLHLDVEFIVCCQSALQATLHKTILCGPMSIFTTKSIVWCAVYIHFAACSLTKAPVSQQSWWLVDFSIAKPIIYLHFDTKLPK